MAATLSAAHWHVVLQESFLLCAESWITGGPLLLSELVMPIRYLLNCQVVTQLVTHRFLSL